MESSAIVGVSIIVVRSHCARSIAASACFTRKKLLYLLLSLHSLTSTTKYLSQYLISSSYHTTPASLPISVDQTSVIIYPSITDLTSLIMVCISRRLSPKHLTRDLRELGFKEELVRKFVERPDSVEQATALLKSYSPPSRKPRKGRYNDLCLRKNSRNQRKSALETKVHVPSILTHLSLGGL
jgi:hypothetical protein